MSEPHPTASTFVIHVENDHHFSLLEEEALSKNIPLIVKFSAVWCGPCRNIAPVFESLAQENTQNGIFVHVDVDQLPETTSKFKITAMPTFKILRPSEGETMVEVGDLQGANKVKLEALIDVHCS